MDTNTQKIVSGVLQAVLPGLLGYVVAKGWLPADSVPEITAAVITIVCAGWSVKTNFDK
jgi:hypothetical protein